MRTLASVWIAAALLAVSLPVRGQDPTPPKVRRETDPFTGERNETVQLGEAGWGYGSQKVLLYVARTAPKAGRATMRLGTVFLGPDWAFLRDDAPLLVLIDSAVIELPNVGAVAREVSSDASVGESAAFTVTAEQLRRIAAAGDVMIRVQGLRQNVDRSLSIFNIEAVKVFLRDVLDAGSDGS
jgi:hypothetical protein